MLSLFGAHDFKDLAQGIGEDQSLETLDLENHTGFYYHLTRKLPSNSSLNVDLLKSYEENIIHHTLAISERRGEVIRWKYFQYLALLFTEIFLDRYFTGPDSFLRALNAEVTKFNEGKQSEDQLPPYNLDDLRKICFWMAMGSGKTLIMHVNILQYQHYLRSAGRGGELDRVILLTPKEGLSRQHLDELLMSGFLQAELFEKDKQSSLPALGSMPVVEIIDIHKLEEEAGDTTVAVESFEGRNLVLVDEGHTGTTGEDWLSKRDQLCENGFSFEYSATFGQAMKASKKKDLVDKYAKSIIFDYSYKYFYEDGYGKNYWILNIPEETNEEQRTLYLTASLLTFYQQQKIYKDNVAEFRRFLVAPPLWIFVGGSVTALRTENKRKVSDVIDVLLFLAEFVGNKEASIQKLEQLLSGKSGILNKSGADLFATAFPFISRLSPSAEDVYSDIMKTTFNSGAPAKLHVELLKGTEGELALRLGDADPFGVVNVGDAVALRKLCEEHSEFVVSDQEFSHSLFFSIEKPTSKINLLIGAKKFTEGWNSYRVSTMGLMNIGRTEGPEIIQMFGRGVRLRGLAGCLKRSAHVPGSNPPRFLRYLETINVFGVRADYMRQFKEYLEEEGVPTEGEPAEFPLLVVPNLGSKKLKFLRLDDKHDYARDAPKPILGSPNEAFRRSPVSFNRYTRLETQASSELGGAGRKAKLEVCVVLDDHLAFLDWESIYWELERYKSERGWHNLVIRRETLQSILRDHSWYTLNIPRSELDFDTFKKVGKWQELATIMLKRYMERFYKLNRDRWERSHLQLTTLQSDDPNLKITLRFIIEASKQELLSKLGELKAAIDKGELKDFSFGALNAIVFERHLYRPLIYLGVDGITVTPVSLNDGEANFVKDLRKYFEANGTFFKGKELYLLRNQSRGKGIGFFEAGNFYPDFILWLVVGDVQHIVFIDPKGIRELNEDNPKIQFYKTVKELEDEFNGENVTFDSFIVSVTPYASVGEGWDLDMEQFKERHVLFQVDERGSYIETLLRSVVDQK